jgi:hypothetical protein
VLSSGTDRGWPWTDSINLYKRFDTVLRRTDTINLYKRVNRVLPRTDTINIYKRVNRVLPRTDTINLYKRFDQVLPRTDSINLYKRFDQVLPVILLKLVNFTSGEKTLQLSIPLRYIGTHTHVHIIGVHM